MPKTPLSRAESARADAVAKFSKAKQAETASARERKARHAADMDKMIRLRGLRLQSEAADKEAAAALPRPSPRKRPAKRPRSDETS